MKRFARPKMVTLTEDPNGELCLVADAVAGIVPQSQAEVIKKRYVILVVDQAGVQYHVEIDDGVLVYSHEPSLTMSKVAEVLVSHRQLCVAHQAHMKAPL